MTTFTAFEFRGCAKRSTFWLTELFTTAFFALALDLFDALPMNDDEVWDALFLTATLIPIVWVKTALYVRRWHDLRRSGWMSLLLLIPLVNVLLWLVLGSVRGTSGPNQCGADPRAPESVAAEIVG